MKINIEKVKKVNLVFDKIQKLQTEISKVDNLAMFAASNDFKAKLKLTLNDSKTILDTRDSKILIPSSDFSPPSNDWMKMRGREINYSYRAGLFERMWLDEPQKKDNDNSISNEISETATMEILGILLREKQKKLELLIDELKELGFSI